MGQDLPVIIILLKDAINVIWGEVIPEKFIIYGSAHQNDSNLWKFTYNPLNSEQDKVSINISLMDFIKYDEGKLLEELSAMNYLL